ncbi:hypothetical protein [Mastigocladopsis repens]|uniref:hypothetical protein n=1 Tax=Mastigocladopsis repens TaxID=221287 RepID=UPI000314B228|nr:hypothetical protein [Mastigocladopsis repens]
MAKKTNGSETSNSIPSQVELELLEVLLAADDETYPWNPADEESENYFAQIEQQFQLEDVLDEELTTRSQAFYNRLDTLWSNNFNSKHYKCNTKPSVLATLQKNLHAGFPASVPQDWITAIAQKAAEIFSSGQSKGEQLVECVQSVLPNWETDDLLVMARPFAYAMRSGERQNVNSVVDNVGNREWTNLSEIEKAKVSLAVAYQALNQLDNFQEEA